MLKIKWFYYLWMFGTIALATPISLTSISDAEPNQLFSQLISEQNPTLAADAMSSLLAYIAPNIKKIPGYNGLFAGNCSVFFNNVSIGQVGCNIIPVAVVSVNQTQQLNAPVQLPREYATQITQSHILLASLFADWSRKIAQKAEQFEVSLYPKVETCTQSMTESESESASKTSLSETLSKTAINSHTVSELLTRTASISESPSSGISSSISETGFRTESSSQSDANTISKTLSRLSGLLAAWNAGTGAYDDGTGHLGRYNASNGVVTDSFTGLDWQQASSNTIMSWDDAVLYCSNRTTGGFNDWRLPNNAELTSLVDYTISFQGPVPGINSVFNNTPTNYFYSSTPLVGSAAQQPWWMSFGQTACYSGLLDSLEYTPSCAPAVASQGYARCVRSPHKPLPAVRYTTTSNIVTDTITGLIWQRVSTGGPMKQASALTHCSTLSLPGCSSVWKVPTVKELATLVDYSVSHGNLMMDATVFTEEPVNYFWASSSLAGNPTYAYVWYIHFGLGIVGGYGVPNGYVRCVACSVPPTSGLLAAWNASSGVYADGTSQLNRYSVSNGIVTDALTGIQWQQNVSSSVMNWNDALAYCANQTTGGLNGWRVPNIGELQSLLDESNARPFINSAAFPLASSADIWSSTPEAGNPGYSWYIAVSGFGDTSFATVGSAKQVRCVRSCYQARSKSRYMVTPGVVNDTVTGLIWQQKSTNLPQPAGMAYCNNLTLNAFNSVWRLPTLKELVTLIDYSVPLGNLTMDTTAFPREPASSFWVSSIVAGNGAGRNVMFNPGYTTYNPIYLGRYIRCVACSVPPASGLLAAWNASTGVYEDATNQTGRYSASNGIVTDALTGIQWQQNTSTTAMNWADAAAYCANQTLGGLSGWRVPNIAELGTLVDYTISSPSINLTAFPETLSSPFFRSSTPAAGNAGYSWNVHENDGGVYSDPKTAGYLVRCIRSCYSSPTTTRYIAALGAVTDIVTGLVWQQKVTASVIYLDAVSFCQNFNLSSSVWRLPTIKELSTLNDYSVSQGSLSMDSVLFPGEPASTYWSSTIVANDPTNAWIIYFSSGILNPHGLGSTNYVRCVRFMKH